MKELYIGRTKGENDIVLEDAKISRKHHCKCVLHSDGSITIKDLGSTNGVFVDGKRISDEITLTDKSNIKIGGVEVTLTDVRKWFEQKKHSVVEQCEKIKQKYEDQSRRYHNNLKELLKAADISKEPFVPQFPSDEVKVEYYIKEYNAKIAAVKELLAIISKSSRKETRQYEDDIDLLQQYYKSASGDDKDVCDDIRRDVRDMMIDLKKYVVQTVGKALSDINTFYTRVFNEFYETCYENDLKWNKITSNHIVSMSDLYYRNIETNMPLFDADFSINQMEFMAFLDRKNLLVRYNTQTSKLASDIVNTTIARVLSSSAQGNAVIHMMDAKDLGGTSNQLKLLNRKVFRMLAEPEDIRAELSGIFTHIENVVQNLLQGEYTSLAQYNRGKENQEPYHIIVLKDFPFGVTTESAHLLHKILSNGMLAGVDVIFLLNEDLVKNNDEAQKVVDFTGIEKLAKEHLFEINLIEETPERSVPHYSSLSNEQMDSVIKYVNAGFEIKKETVLRLLDYMIHEKDWWMGKSANRIDVPFGIASNMQTQALHITQESGQNSAVVIGIPGSGKSVFLHALIANAVVHYSPKELQLYLLDFSGVEFNIYAQHKLPHARVIAPEAEREFGLSILRELKAEGDRRMTLCRDNDVTNIVELKEKHPEMIVPRLLVIVDEFQKLFEIDSDKISQEANRYIHIIIQEYRKFGINLILATQKLPSKNILPRDLIANRVVFKADPNDFGELIKWPSQMPRPQLGTGVCVYNDESGSEYANNVTRGFYIKTSTDLNKLLDQVSEFAYNHQAQLDDSLTMRVFRSNDLPDFNNKVMAEKHYELSDVPKEVGVYVGESIAVSATDVYVPLVKESNNNILIIGGRQDVAKKIAYYTILSQAIAHNVDTATFAVCNFMRNDDELQTLFNSEQIEAVKQTSKWFEAKKADEVTTLLSNLKELLDYRKSVSDESEMDHVYIHFTAFQLGRMFDAVGSGSDRPSDCAKLLLALLKDGPSLGLFTVLQVDNLNSLNRLGRGVLTLFNHRIALQMNENDSNKVVGSAAANKLKISGRPSSEYRALYYNDLNNEMTKFKPYK